MTPDQFAKFWDGMGPIFREYLATVLATAVADGVISQDQADAITAGAPDNPTR